jgi:hypothetical protein
VVEHFTKDEGQQLIKLCLEKGKYVLITIPIGRHWKQDGTNDNPHEAHKSIWYNNDFTGYKYYKIKSFNDLTLRNYSVVLLSKSRIKYDKRFGKYFFIKNILKHKLGLKKLIESFEHRKEITDVVFWEGILKVKFYRRKKLQRIFSGSHQAESFLFYHIFLTEGNTG